MTVEPDFDAVAIAGAPKTVEAAAAFRKFRRVGFMNCAP